MTVTTVFDENQAFELACLPEEVADMIHKAMEDITFENQRTQTAWMDQLLEQVSLLIGCNSRFPETYQED